MDSGEASLGMRFRARISFLALARGKAEVEGRRRSSGIEPAEAAWERKRPETRRRRKKRERFPILFAREETGGGCGERGGEW